MDFLKQLKNVKGLAEPLDTAQVNKLSRLLSKALSSSVYASSLAAANGTLWFLSKKNGQKMVGQLCLERESCADLVGETIEINLDGKKLPVRIGPTSTVNTALLRKHLSFTAPVLIGRSKSFGGGDRLGLAGPAHIRAVRGKPLRIFLAQQSIREMARTNRSPQEVMDDAGWAVLQEGFRDGFGSDADHLKTTQDIDRCLDAGFTLFTIDPGEHVDDRGWSMRRGIARAIRVGQLEESGNDQS